MGCSASQERVIERLRSLGAAAPADGAEDLPDFSILKSVEDADDYIRKWRHLLPSVPATTLRAEASAMQAKQKLPADVN